MRLERCYLNVENLVENREPNSQHVDQVKMLIKNGPKSLTASTFFEFPTLPTPPTTTTITTIIYPSFFISSSPKTKKQTATLFRCASRQNEKGYKILPNRRL